MGRFPIRTLATAAVAAAALTFASGSRAAENTPPAAQALVPVTVAKPQVKDLRPSTTFTGRIEAIDKVDLRARIEGFLEKRLFTEGADVKEGELLFTIEKAPYEAAVDQAKGAVDSAQAELTRADLEVDRQATLVSKDVAARTKLEDATAKQGIVRGNLEQAKATLRKAELDLSYTDIKAPIAGRIGRSNISVGNFVTPSSGALATIVSQDPIYVTFSVTQREMLEVRARGDANRGEAVVSLLLADGSRYGSTGTIKFVDVQANQGTDSVLVRASFANPDRILVDGQLVTVIAEGGTPQSALVIPQSAVQADQQGTFVLVVNKDNKIEVRRIEVGAASGSDLAVKSGLTADDRIVTEGIQKVRPGQEVDPHEAATGG